MQGRPLVARQLGAATRFPGWLSYKAYGHGRAMLAPTGVFRQSEQSCGLFFRARLANPPAPTKKLWQEYCRSFFSLVYRAKSAKSITDFQSAFYRDVQLLPGGWIFLLPAFSAVFRMFDFPAAGDRGAVHAHPVKSETGHRIAAGTCNPGGKQV